MKDAQFGELRREAHESWYTAVPIPYFAGCGDLLVSPPHLTAGLTPRLPAKHPPTVRQMEALGQLRDMLGGMANETPAAGELLKSIAVPSNSQPANPAPQIRRKKADPWDEDELLRHGKLKILFEDRTDNKQLPQDMRDAWTAFAGQGDGMWDQIVDWLARDYQTQRPVALRWMKVVYGDLPFERQLPETKVPGDIRPLIMPVQVCVKRGVAESVVVLVYFRCAWTSELVGVLIREGRIHSLLPSMEGLGTLNPSAGAWLDHPVFGLLRPSYRCWAGQTACEPFTHFGYLADKQIEFWKGPSSVRCLIPPNSWDLAHSIFGLKVYTLNGAQPSAAQVREYSRFRDHAQQYCKVVLDAVFDHYQKTFEQRRRDWKGAHRDIYIPEATNVNDLQTVMSLCDICIYPEAADGRVCMGFEIIPCWNDYASTCVLLQEGNFIELCECKAKEMERDAMLLSGYDVPVD